MEARRAIDEMNVYLRQVMDYVGSSDFDLERRLARREFFGSEEPAFKDEEQLMESCAAYYSWFMFDRPDSRRERTPVRLWVEQNPELPERITSNLLACEDSVTSTYRVVETGSDYVVVLDLLGDETDYYRVQTRADRDYAVGELLTARIVRWDEQYLFHGQIDSWPRSARDIVGPLARRRGAPPDADEPTLLSRRRWIWERRQRP